MTDRILLPIDGSAHAKKAAELCGFIASRDANEIILLHTLDPDRMSDAALRFAEVEHRASRKPEDLPWVANAPGELMAMLRPKDSKQERQRALEAIGEKVVKTTTDILEREGVSEDKIRVIFRNGRPARAILKTIEEQNIDMVIMGSRGLSEVKGMLLGSVSQRVASAAPCTVVTAR